MDYRLVQDKVIIPILLLFVSGLGAWAVGIDRSVAENAKEIEFSEEQKADIKALLEAAQAKQNVMAEQNFEIEKQLLEMRMTQTAFREDVNEIKDQTKLILEALREPR